MKHNSTKKSKEERKLEYAKISFSFCLTKDEADKIINDPSSSIARKARKYMYSILKEAASRFFSSKSDNVTECKESDRKD